MSVESSEFGNGTPKFQTFAIQARRLDAVIRRAASGAHMQRILHLLKALLAHLGPGSSIISTSSANADMTSAHPAPQEAPA